MSSLFTGGDVHENFWVVFRQDQLRSELIPLDRDDSRGGAKCRCLKDPNRVQDTDVFSTRQFRDMMGTRKRRAVKNLLKNVTCYGDMSNIHSHVLQELQAKHPSAYDELVEWDKMPLQMKRRVAKEKADKMSKNPE